MGARYTVTAPLRGTRAFRGAAESSDGSRRDVVIQRFLPELTTNQRFVETFLDDLRSALPLKHSNIVEVLDIARTPANAYYVVTEYLEGCDLKALVTRRERIPLPHVLYVATECCKALTYAQAHDVIHRDVSPRAVLLSTKGEVKLGDFGLARANTTHESSDPGIVKGNFGYLSPEGAEALPVDHRGDVFALGVVLWELLAGRRLFLGGTDYETVMLVRGARFVPIDGLDRELDAVLRRALARDAGERYPHAADLADAMTRYAVSHGIEMSPRDTAMLVRDVWPEISRERVEPIDARILARVQDDARRMSSIIQTTN